jgi:hypothetical protein
VIDSKIKDAKLSFRSSDGDIVNAPRQIKMNSNEISSLRLAIDRENTLEMNLISPKECMIQRITWMSFRFIKSTL